MSNHLPPDIDQWIKNKTLVFIDDPYAKIRFVCMIPFVFSIPRYYGWYIREPISIIIKSYDDKTITLSYELFEDTVVSLSDIRILNPIWGYISIKQLEYTLSFGFKEDINAVYDADQLDICIKSGLIHYVQHMLPTASYAFKFDIFRCFDIDQVCEFIVAGLDIRSEDMEVWCLIPNYKDNHHENVVKCVQKINEARKLNYTNNRDLSILLKEYFSNDVSGLIVHFIYHKPFKSLFPSYYSERFCIEE